MPLRRRDLFFVQGGPTFFPQEPQCTYPSSTQTMDARVPRIMIRYSQTEAHLGSSDTCLEPCQRRREASSSESLTFDVQSKSTPGETFNRLGIGIWQEDKRPLLTTTYPGSTYLLYLKLRLSDTRLHSHANRHRRAIRQTTVVEPRRSPHNSQQ